MMRLGKARMINRRMKEIGRSKRNKTMVKPIEMNANCNGIRRERKRMIGCGSRRRREGMNRRNDKKNCELKRKKGKGDCDLRS